MSSARFTPRASVRSCAPEIVLMAAGMLKEGMATRVAVTVTTSRVSAELVESELAAGPCTTATSDAATPRTATKAATHTTPLKRLANKDILATTPTCS